MAQAEPEQLTTPREVDWKTFANKDGDEVSFVMGFHASAGTTTQPKQMGGPF